MVKLHCRDSGMDCSFHTKGSDEREMTQELIQHMHTAHDMDAIPAEVMFKIYTAVRTKNTTHKVRTAGSTESISAY